MTTVENARLFASTLTANGALLAGKHTPVDASGGARTVTLPLTATTGAALSVEKRDASTNPVIVSGSLRGSLTTISLVWQYETLTLRWNGTTWLPTEGHKTKAALDAAYASTTALATNTSAIAANTAALAQFKIGSLLYRRGVAFSGGEYFNNHFYPSQNAVQLAASRGHKIARLAVKWEYLQPTLGGALDATEMAGITTFLGYCATAGIQVIVEPHNYGDYITADGVTHQLNDPDGVVTNALFADFWTKLSTALLNNPAVYGYELLNEPRYMFGAYTASGSDLINAGGFDAGIPSNISVTNGTAAWSTHVGRNGTGRTLAVTATATGDIQVKFTGIAVSASQKYDFHAYFLSGGSSRSVHVGLMCKDSTGTLLNASEQITGGFLPDKNWVVIQSQGTPLFNTATVDLMFTIRSAAAGEVHYIDDLVFVPISSSSTAAATWEISAQAAVDAIRAVDTSRMIWIPLYEFQSVSRVTVNHPNGPWITNGGTIRYAGHIYLDFTGGGVYTTTFAADTSSAIASGYANLQTYVLSRLQTFTDWLTKYSAKGVLSEIGWPWNGTDQSSWQTVGDAVYSAADAAALDVTYWFAGEYSNNVPGSATTAYNGYPGVATPIWPQATVIEAHPTSGALANSGGTVDPTLFDKYRTKARRITPSARTTKYLLANATGSLTGSGTGSNMADTTDFVAGTSAAVLVTNGTGAFSSYSFPTLSWDASASIFRLVIKLDDWTNLSNAALDLRSGATGSYTNYYQALLTGEGLTTNTSRIIRSGEWLTLDFPRDAFVIKAGTPSFSTIGAARIEATDKNGIAQTIHVNALGLVPDSTVFPAGAIVFTLDDSDSSQWTIAKPILDAYGFPATVFPIVSKFSSAGWTNTRLQAAQDLLGWEVGMHSLTLNDHSSPFYGFSDAQLRSRFDDLATWHASLGLTTESLAWWPGGFDQNAERVAREYVGWARTTTPGSQPTSVPQPMRLRSNGTALQTSTQVQAMIDAAISSKSICIFNTYSIVASGATGSATNQATFQAAADYAASTGTPVYTLGDAMRRLGH